MRIVDLFAGCGGLSFGFKKLREDATVVGYELDQAGCQTAVQNGHHMHCVRLDESSQIEGHDVLIGGPPCQPFSRSGSQAGKDDIRDMVPVFIQQLKQHRPRIAIMENVVNLAGQRHKQYFDIVIDNIAELGYVVETKILNAADYGVPQTRQRLFIVAHHGGFTFPAKSVRSYVTVGQTLDSSSFDARTGDEHPSLLLTPNMDEYIAKYEKKSKCINPRDLARDRPARTLTCRNLTGCTSDMIRLRLDDGRRRQLLVEEAALLQSFPRNYFAGLQRSTAMKLIGNSVPPLLSEALAAQVYEYMAHVNDITKDLPLLKDTSSTLPSSSSTTSRIRPCSKDKNKRPQKQSKLDNFFKNP